MRRCFNCSVSVDIAVPSVYSLIAEFGKFEGTLDGKDVSASVRIEAGHHEIRRAGGSGRMALLWVRAAEKGYNPFRPAKRDRWTPQD